MNNLSVNNLIMKITNALFTNSLRQRPPSKEEHSFAGLGVTRHRRHTTEQNTKLNKISKTASEIKDNPSAGHVSKDFSA